MKLAWKIWFILVLFVFGTFFVMNAKINADTTPTAKAEIVFDVSEPVYPQLSPAVRDLAPVSQPPLLNREVDMLWLGEGLGESSTKIGPDTLVPFSQNNGRTPDPLLTFEGLGTDGFTPPDTIGDVGPNHYIQMVNVSFQIWDKGDPDNGIPPSIVQADTPFNALFAGFGGVCQNSNSGDPIVMYDDMADRWFMSQMGLTGGQALCIAVSTSPDPTGTYYLYAFPMPAFPDYPKYGIWPDAYFATTNTGFPNQYWAHAFDRAAMLAGNPATRQSFGNNPNLMLPADVDGPLAPPVGAPGIFYTFFHPNGNGHPGGSERLAFYEFDVDWATPANSTYTLVAELPIAAFNYTLCGFFVECVQQPGTSQLLDDIAWWPMHRLQYRNFGDYAAMVGNFTVDGDGANHGGIRWFEVRKTGSTYALHQEGTHFPDSNTRWMGSIAMDGSGNIALGYSVSSNTTIPSIRYVTRRLSDPLGTLNAEASMWVGTGVQTSIERWGDYSGLAVDPVDNCTFWYTTEYHDINDGGFNWNTRVGIFRVPECTGGLGPDFSMALSPNTLEICAPDSASVDVNFNWFEGYDAPVALNAVGVPAGYSASFSVNPVMTPTVTSELSLLNVGAVTPGAYDVDIVGIGSPTPTHTATLQLNLFDGIPGAPTLLTPANGATNIPVTPDFSWNAVSGAAAYTLELADDINFNNIIYTTTVSDPSHTLPGANALAYNTWHYWRVTASNACGSGVISPQFRFRTVEQPATFCATPNLAIPDNNPTGVSHTMNIPASANILDVDIYVKATHTWVGDLRFAVSHNATNATIIDRPGVPASTFGCSGDNYDVTVNDEGPDGNIETQCATNPAISGDRVGGDPPNSSLLAAYDGMDISGDWTITVSDHAGSDIGTLVEWCVVPTLEASGGGVDLSPDQDGSGAPGSVVVYTLSITNTGSVSDTFDLTVDAQWATMLSASSISLDAGAVGTFTAEVSVPGNAAAGDVGLSLVTATSQSDGSVSDDAFLTTTATELRDVTLSADPDALSGEPGAVVTYTVHITNTGNAADSFTLGMSGNAWMTHVEPLTVTLAAGEGTAVQVTVHIPGDAANGDDDTVTITAVSDNDPSATASVDLTTTASVPVEPGYTIYLPIILKP
ncbi:MAG: hypothetical protein KF770_06445 [Anaerolineae bacterium]|nr:hypothetical protein [Anaerolineae bacterium]